MNLDPLAEDFYSYSPYNAMANNPIFLADPTGMAAEWKPELAEDGSTYYIAEDGDTVDTFANQYGVTRNQAKELIGTETVTAGETVVSGQDVYDMNPYGLSEKSEVLKLDDWTNEQKNLDHAMYSFAHAKSTGKDVMVMSDYFKDIFKKLSTDIKANGFLNIDDEKVRVSFELSTYTPVGGFRRHAFGASYAYSLISEVSPGFTNGFMFGKSQEIANYKLNAYIKYPKNKLGYKPGLSPVRYINITTLQSQYKTFENYFERGIKPASSNNKNFKF